MSIKFVDEPGRSLFHSLIRRAKSAISRRRELSGLDAREVEAVARDLNIPPADLVALMSASSEPLDSLAKRLAYEGFSEEALAASHPAELRDLRRVCSLCSSKARCARDLRHKRMATPAKYCPNEPTLRLLVREAYRARAAQVPGFQARLF